MLATLDIIMAITLPLEFILVTMYFFYLYKFKKMVCRDHFAIWEKEKGNSRVLESSFQKSYRILKRINYGEVDGIRLSNGVEIIANKTKRIMYASLLYFSLLLVSVLLLIFIDPMK